MNHVSFHRGALSAAAVVLLTSAQAHAQSTPAPAAPASDAAETQTVVVRASADASAGGLKGPYAGGQVAKGGRVGLLGNQDLMDTPFVVTNYTQKLIQDQQATSLADVLQNDPAVRVTRGFGNFQQAYMVRGLVIYSDDISYNGLYGLLPRQYLAAELVERVEVLRGASAFLNGAAPGGSGLGGAINIMPKRAANAPQAEIGLGVDGGQVSEALDIGRRFGAHKELGLRANVVHSEGDTAVKGERDKLDAALLGADYRRRQASRLGRRRNPGQHPWMRRRPISTSSSRSGRAGRVEADRPTLDVLARVRHLSAPCAPRYDPPAGIYRAGRRRFPRGRRRQLYQRRDDQRRQRRTDALRRRQHPQGTSIKTGEIGLRGAFSTGLVEYSPSSAPTVPTSRSRRMPSHSPRPAWPRVALRHHACFDTRPTYYTGGSCSTRR